MDRTKWAETEGETLCPTLMVCVSYTDDLCVLHQVVKGMKGLFDGLKKQGLLDEATVDAQP